MSDHQYPKKIDLLDAALTVYRQVDAPPGLEARILGTIEGNLRRRRIRVQFLAVAAAAAACLGLALFLLVPARIPLSEPTIVAVPVPPPAAPAPVKSEVEIPRVAPRVQDAAAPRQSTFPAPSAPSEQERALISLMRSRRQILVAMWQSRPPDIRENIEIAPIELDPLVSGAQNVR